MKKILLFFAAASALVACDPVQEDISMGSSITAEQLKEMCKVTTDKSASGKNGNVITCETSAPVSAAWNIAGKDLPGAYVTKKVKLGEQVVKLTALCGDGTELTVDFPLTVEEITDPLQKYYIYGEDPEKEAPFQPAAWNAQAMRFSENEGGFEDIMGHKNYLPYLSDDIYFGHKTLIFDITDCTEDINCKIMTGWWSPVFYEDYDIYKAIGGPSGLWELPLTDEIAAACAKGGDSRDLDLMLKSGSCTINSIYYEE